jgi:hypothetical protein
VHTALALAAVGVLLAAADTYVIVLALPDMMVGVGLDVDELQRAAPLVSMFLLGASPMSWDASPCSSEPCSCSPAVRW